MRLVAILRRTLKEGQTYEDFRRAWYHKTGFGTENQMLTVLNGANPREIIVIAITEASMENASRLLAIDAEERASNPLDEVIEGEIDRTFGILIAEDDFSAEGPLAYQPAMINGSVTDLAAVADFIGVGRELLERELSAHPES